MIFDEVFLGACGLSGRDQLPYGPLFEGGKRFRLYGEPNRTNLNIFPQEDRDVVLSGRTFNPVSTVSNEAIPESIIRDLAAGRINEIQFSGVVITCAFPGDEATICLVIDKYGLRPLYYACKGGRLIFATKLAGIETLRGNKTWRVGADALFHYYHFGFTPSDRTMSDGVRKVPPGSMPTADRHGDITVEPYFRLADLYRPQEFKGISDPLCPEMFFQTPAEVQDELGLFAMPAFRDDELVSPAINLPTRWKLRAGKPKSTFAVRPRRNI